MCSRSHSWRLHRSGVILRSCSMRLMLLLDAVAQPTSNIRSGRWLDLQAPWQASAVVILLSAANWRCSSLALSRPCASMVLRAGGDVCVSLPMGPLLLTGSWAACSHDRALCFAGTHPQLCRCSRAGYTSGACSSWEFAWSWPLWQGRLMTALGDDG